MCDDHSNRATSSDPHSLRVEGQDYPVISLPIPPDWHSLALEKGYDLVARIQDKDHLALRCHECGGLNRVKAFTLRSARPNCQVCQDLRWHTLAADAGARFVRRCPHEHRYVWLRLPCGHEIRRQIGLVRRVARGEIAFRCNTCHSTREKREARERDWDLIGPDPKGNPNYRLYVHTCDHRQRIARANMQSGRFGCAGCGEAWPAAPSALYLMRFTLPNSRVLIKLGMSRDANSRLHHQLLRHDELEAEVLDHLPMATGQSALRLEKGLHAIMRRRFPQHVVPHAVFAAHLKVASEIYDPEHEPFVRTAFNRVRQRGAA